MKRTIDRVFKKYCILVLSVFCFLLHTSAVSANLNNKAKIKSKKLDGPWGQVLSRLYDGNDECESIYRTIKKDYLLRLSILEKKQEQADSLQQGYLSLRAKNLLGERHDVYTEMLLFELYALRLRDICLIEKSYLLETPHTPMVSGVIPKLDTIVMKSLIQERDLPICDRDILVQSKHVAAFQKYIEEQATLASLSPYAQRDTKFKLLSSIQKFKDILQGKATVLHKAKTLKLQKFEKVVNKHHNIQVLGGSQNSAIYLNKDISDED